MPPPQRFFFHRALNPPRTKTVVPTAPALLSRQQSLPDGLPGHQRPRELHLNLQHWPLTVSFAAREKPDYLHLDERT